MLETKQWRDDDTEYEESFSIKDKHLENALHSPKMKLNKDDQISDTEEEEDSEDE